jgi:hypothetical protein
MELNIAISPSEKEVAKIIGKDNWANLITEKTKNQPTKCFFCDYPQMEENFERINLSPKLRHHIMPFSNEIDIKKDFNKLDIVIVCDACHAIQHFDNAVKNNWIKLVNSSFDQVDLVKACRWGNKIVNAYITGGYKVEKNIFPLKKTPESYLSEIMDSNLNVNKKIKVIFTKNFDWSNCR